MVVWMDSNLMDKKNQKISELSSKETELSSLNRRLSDMKRKEYLAELIEEKRNCYYNQHEKGYHFDRGQYREIAVTIRGKNEAVDKALKDHEAAIKPIQIELQEQTQRLELTFLANDLRCIKQKEAFEKKYRDSRKLLDKECVNELRRLFAELDAETARFYKKGISKERLEGLIRIMDKIESGCSAIGTFPISCQQKIYKWKLIAKDIPYDYRTIDGEKEEAERQEALRSLKSTESEVIKYRKEVASVKAEIDKESKNCNKLKKTLLKLEKTYTIRENEIKQKAMADQKNVRDSFEAIRSEIDDSYTRRKNEQQRSIEKKKEELAGRQKTVDNLRSEYNAIQAKHNSTFVLLFSQRKEMKVKMAAIDAEISSEKSEISQLQEQIDHYLKNDLDNQHQYALDENEQKLAESLRNIDENMQSQLICLAEELNETRKIINDSEMTIESKEKRLRELLKTLEETEKDLKELKEKLESMKSFHYDYLIRSAKNDYSTRYLQNEVTNEIVRVNKQIERITAEIDKLKRIIADIDAKIVNAEKEEKARMLMEQKKKREEEKKAKEVAEARAEEEKRIQKEQEMARKAKAKEEERLRIEQKKRELKIQNELLQR